MKWLYLHEENLGSLSVRHTVETALRTGYESPYGIELVQPRQPLWGMPISPEWWKKIHWIISGKGCQRIVIADYEYHLHQPAVQTVIHTLANWYAVTVVSFDIPVFIPEAVPSEEKWLAQSWRHAVGKNGWVALTNMWEPLGTQNRILIDNRRLEFKLPE